jgi:cation transport ATPase
VVNVKAKGEEIRRRFPRIVMNLVMAVIFWIIDVFVPPTVSTVVIPGLNTNAGLLTWIVVTVIMAIFLIRALSDALVLGDILTDVVVRRLGIKEERSPKRAARDFIYIIIIILVVTALSPILANVTDIGHLLTTAATYVALALIIILIYDMGRILYRIIEQKAELLADRLTQMAEKKKNSE